jgi:small subunit ribosomal protein S17
MKNIVGTVVSLNQDKTAQVSVTRQWPHPLYKKLVTRSKKYACHYEKIDLVLGDNVMIETCAPISKTKRFRVVGKVEEKK